MARTVATGEGGAERTIFYAAIGVAIGSLFGLPLQLGLSWSAAYLVLGYAAVLAVVGFLLGRRENRVLEAGAVDPRKQVANFVALTHRLAQEVDHATRHGLPLSLLLIDLRRGGDAPIDGIVLKVAHVLRRLCRAADLIAVCDCNKLGIVAPCSTAQQAVQLAERVLDELEDEETRSKIGMVHAIIGIAEQQASGADASRMMQNADQALLIAKVGGREVWVAGGTTDPLEATDATSDARVGKVLLTADACVTDIMTRRVVCLRPETPVAQLADLFIERDIGGAPVLDENGRILGIVSKSELLRSCFETPRANQVVDDIMTAIVFRLPEDATVAQAARLMAYEGVARIVIVSPEGVIVGILSADDILRCVAAPQPTAPEPAIARDTPRALNIQPIVELQSDRRLVQDPRSHALLRSS